MPQVTINATDGGSFSAYLSLPKNVTGKVPGIVMMQQIFGANAEMRGFTDDYAAQGYVAICPDLFWRARAGRRDRSAGARRFPEGGELCAALQCRSGRRGSESDRRVPTRASRLQRQDRYGRLLSRRFARLSDGGAQRCRLQCRLFRRADREISRRGGQRRAAAHAAHSGGRSARVARGAGANQSRARRPGRAMLLSGADHAFNRVGAKSYNRK